MKVAYTLDEAAEAAGTSRSVIDRALKAGELTPRYPSSRPVIQAEELSRWVNECPTERN